MLITSTREHEIHTEFSGTYANMHMFEKCICLARLYDKPFDYECTDILWSEDSLRDNAREYVLSEPINSPGWRTTSRGDVLMSIRLSTEDKSHITSASLKVKNVGEDTVLLSECRAFAENSSAIVYIQPTGIPFIALQYATLILSLKTESPQPIKVVSTYRVLPPSMRRHFAQSRHEVRTFRQDFPSISTPIVYFSNGKVSKTANSCTIM